MEVGDNNLAEASQQANWSYTFTTSVIITLMIHL